MEYTRDLLPIQGRQSKKGYIWKITFHKSSLIWNTLEICCLSKGGNPKKVISEMTHGYFPLLELLNICIIIAPNG